MEYHLSVGDITFDGVGSFLTNSDTSNRIVVFNPFGIPSSLGPEVDSELSTGFYSMGANGQGTFTVDLSGLGEPNQVMCLAVTQDGNIGIASGDTTPGVLGGENGRDFALAFKKFDSPSVANVRGAYWGAIFGDEFDAGSQRSYYYSNFFIVTTDGMGNVTGSSFEANEDGTLSVENITATYTVDAGTGEGIITEGSTEVMRFRLSVPDVSGASQALMFYSNPYDPLFPSDPNPRRELGLAVKLH